MEYLHTRSCFHVTWNMRARGLNRSNCERKKKTKPFLVKPFPYTVKYLRMKCGSARSEHLFAQFNTPVNEPPLTALQTHDSNNVNAPDSVEGTCLCAGHQDPPAAPKHTK